MTGRTLIVGEEDALEQLMLSSGLPLTGFFRIDPEAPPPGEAAVFLLLDVTKIPPENASEELWGWWEGLITGEDVPAIVLLSLARTNGAPDNLSGNLMRLEQSIVFALTQEYAAHLEIHVIHVQVQGDRSAETRALPSAVTDAIKTSGTSYFLRRFYVMDSRLERGGKDGEIFTSASVWPIAVGRLSAWFALRERGSNGDPVPAQIYAWRHTDLVVSEQSAKLEAQAEISGLEEFGGALRRFSAEQDPLSTFTACGQFDNELLTVVGLEEIPASSVSWAMQNGPDQAGKTVSISRAVNFFDRSGDQTVPIWKQKRSEWLSALGNSGRDLRTRYLLEGEGGLFALENHMSLIEGRSSRVSEEAGHPLAELSRWAAAAAAVLQAREKATKASKVVESIQSNYLPLLFRCLAAGTTACLLSLFGFRLLSAPEAISLPAAGALIAVFLFALGSALLIWKAERAAGENAWGWFRVCLNDHDGALKSLRDLMARTFSCGLEVGDLLNRRSLLGRTAAVLGRIRTILSKFLSGSISLPGSGEGQGFQADHFSNEIVSRKHFSDASRRPLRGVEDDNPKVVTDRSAAGIGAGVAQGFVQKQFSDVTGAWQELFSHNNAQGAVLRKDLESFFEQQIALLRRAVREGVRAQLPKLDCSSDELRRRISEVLRSEDHPRLLSFPHDPHFQAREHSQMDFIADLEDLRRVGLVDPLAVELWPAKSESWVPAGGISR